MTASPRALAPPPDRPGPVPRGIRWVRWAAWAPVATLAVVLYLVPLPVFVLSPGPARDVVPLIRLDGPQVYPPTGHYLLTTVAFDEPNAYTALGAWLDPARSVVPEDEVLGPGGDREEFDRQSRLQMDSSQITAAVVALTDQTGYPEEHGPGALVESILEGSPADGKLFPGDVILEVQGQEVDGPDDVGRRVRAAPPGAPLTFTVRTEDGTEDVAITPGPVPGVDRPAIGISLVPNFPFPLRIQSGGVGGPSAGLMWTLGLIDLLSPADLTGGRTVAGTGEILPDGTVGPIGGVEEKVVGARKAGAQVFLVPRENAEAARRLAGDLVVVPVSTYRDALRYLERTAP